MEGSISPIQPPYPPRGMDHTLRTNAKSYLLESLRRNPVLDLDELYTLGLDPKTLFEILSSKEFEEGLSVKVEGVEMPLKLMIKPIQEGAVVITQINEPLYKEELLLHKDTTHYSLQLSDPNRPVPEELDLAEAHFTMLSHMNTKLNSYQPLTETDLFYLSEHKIDEADIDFELQLAQSAVEGWKEIYNKPAISLRIAEDGTIGEIASISVQSKTLPGTSLMKWVDQFCKFLNVEKMFLEDDAKIELAKVGSYSQRLYRYAIGKNSWYVDTFHFQPYLFDPLRHEIIPSDMTPKTREASDNINFKTVGEVLDLLSDPDYNTTKYPGLIPYLHSLDSKATIQSLIESMGKEVIQQNAPVHNILSLLLTSYLETLTTYRGEDPAKIELKEQAVHILQDKFYLKCYPETL